MSAATNPELRDLSGAVWRAQLENTVQTDRNPDLRDRVSVRKSGFVDETKNPTLRDLVLPSQAGRQELGEKNPTCSTDILVDQHAASPP